MVVSSVSRRLSPFVTLEVDVLILITSAPKYLPASSKEVRVLVLASKNKLTIALPRKVGAFFISRLISFFISTAVCKIRSYSDVSREAKSKMLLFRSDTAAFAIAKSPSRHSTIRFFYKKSAFWSGLDKKAHENATRSARRSKHLIAHLSSLTGPA